MLTTDMLAAMLTRANFDEFDVVCPDGAKATIQPMSDKPVAACLNDVTFYFIYWDISQYIGSAMGHDGESALADLCKILNQHEALAGQKTSEEARIRAYFDEHQANGWTDDDLDWYSDWHKDVFGFRPHGAVCGQYVNPHDPRAMARVPAFNWLQAVTIHVTKNRRSILRRIKSKLLWRFYYDSESFCYYACLSDISDHHQQRRRHQEAAG